MSNSRINFKLSNKQESLNPKLREQGRREQILYNHSNHSSCPFTFNSFTGLTKIHVKRGQYATTNKKLAQLLGCSIDQVRYQLKTWIKEKVVKVNRVKDSKNYDVGILITYNHLFNLSNQLKRESKKYKKKIPNRENSHKAHKLKVKNLDNPKIPTPNKELLSKDNIVKKTTIKKDKKIVVFSFKKDKDFFKVSNQLKNLDFSDKRIENFYLTYSKDSLEKYLKLLELTKSKIKVPCAWYTQALKQSFDLTQVENWRKEQKREERRAIFEELEEIKAKQLQEEKKIAGEKENRLVENWRKEKGEIEENKIYQNVIENWKKRSARCFYDSLVKDVKTSGSLIDSAKKNIFAMAEVKSEILRRIRGGEKQEAILNFKTKQDFIYKKQLTEDEQLENIINQKKQEAIRSGRIKIDSGVQSISSCLSKFKVH